MIWIDRDRDRYTYTYNRCNKSDNLTKIINKCT